MHFFNRNLLSFWVALPLPLLANALLGVNFDDCYVRFQNPQSGQQAINARVTTLNWPTTPSDVARTINDFGNINQQNVQLFLQGGLWALTYAGYSNAVCINSQNGLNYDTTIISVLLPSGVSKVNKVNAAEDELAENNRGISGIFGINTNQPLLPTDWAYTTGLLLKQAISQFEAGVLARTNSYPAAIVNMIQSNGEGVLMVVDI
ncbi:hypothetical protein TARUN_6443 [Trichoderma arundinaceum]|uniref:Uncharacterized protein n=1 Tax=Trichoderma arundinaceum TaxID=490622 RepID=A0A395NIR4_TRIAR|nr:hypothetical protein TARUN_6443 [Trichoderma arundinaceum]